MEFDDWPLREVLAKMISTLKFDRKQGSRSRGHNVGLLNRQKKGSFKKAVHGGDDFASIAKKWLFGLLGLHYAQSEGGVLSDVRSQIDNLYGVGPIELRKDYQTPEG